MDKQLELHFVTEMGRTARLVVQDPKEDLTGQEIQTAMQAIIDANAFITSTGPLVEIKEARLVEREVTVFEFQD